MVVRRFCHERKCFVQYGNFNTIYLKYRMLKWFCIMQNIKNILQIKSFHFWLHLLTFWHIMYWQINFLILSISIKPKKKNVQGRNLSWIIKDLKKTSLF